MKCEEFEERLNLVLDERRRPAWDDEVRLHMDRCGACREIAAAYGLLLDGFYALTAPEPPSDLAVRVLDELKVRPASRRVAVVSAVLATAAAVVVAAWLPWRGDAHVAAKVRPAPAAAAPAGVALGTKASLAAPAARPTQRSGASQPAIVLQELDALPVVGPMFVSMSDRDKKTDPYEALAKGTGQSLAAVVLYMPGFGERLAHAHVQRRRHLARGSERRTAAGDRVDDRDAEPVAAGRAAVLFVVGTAPRFLSGPSSLRDEPSLSFPPLRFLPLRRRVSNAARARFVLLGKLRRIGTILPPISSRLLGGRPQRG